MNRKKRKGRSYQQVLDHLVVVALHLPPIICVMFPPDVFPGMYESPKPKRGRKS